MPTNSRRKSKSVAVKTAELAVAAPQVIVHRLTRMALAGPVQTKRDRRELQRMITEKQSAFTEAWFGMATETLRANQAFALSFFGGTSKSHSPFDGWFSASPNSIQNTANAIADRGLSPFHRKATANARRLSKAR